MAYFYSMYSLGCGFCSGRRKKVKNKVFIISVSVKILKKICRRVLHNPNNPPTFASQFRGIAVTKKMVR